MQKHLQKVNLATFNIQVFGPELEADDEAYHLSGEDKRVIADLPAMLEVVEEELTHALPEGYWARVTEWDK